MQHTHEQGVDVAIDIKIDVSNYIGAKVPLSNFEEAVSLSTSCVGRVILQIP